MSKRYKVKTKGSGCSLAGIGATLMAAGWFAATFVEEWARGTQNPLVGFAQIPLLAASAIIFLIGAILLLIAAIRWLFRTPDKMKSLRSFFASVGDLLASARRFLGTKYGVLFIALVIVAGIGVMLIPEPKQGLVTEWNEDSQTKTEARYRRGLKLTEAVYVDGELVSNTEFYGDGNGYLEKRYVNGQLETESTFDEAGQLSEETTYSDGQYLYRTDFDYYDNGQVKRAMRRISNIEFYERSWFESGQLRVEATIQLSEGGTGLRTEWYENGHRKSEYHYLGGKKHGIGTTWYDNGQKKAEANFINHKRVGMETAWDRVWTEAEIEANKPVPKDTSQLPIPTDGLLAYFPFESNSDDAVYVRSLEADKGISYVERSEGNNAAKFADWSSFSYASEPFKLKTAFTFALWVKFDEVPEHWGNGKLISNSTGATKLEEGRRFWGGYWIDVIPKVSGKSSRFPQIMHPRLYAETNIGDKSSEHRNEITADRAIVVGEWTHIVGVFDGLEKRIYVNGEMAGRKSATPSAGEAEVTYSSASQFEIGGWDWTDSSGLDGEMDDLMIYDRPLSDDEILSVYQTTKE